MDWGPVFLLLGSVLGGGGVLTAVITARTNRKIEDAKTIAQENETKLDAQRVKLEGWEGLVSSLQKDNERLRVIVKEQDETIRELTEENLTLKRTQRSTTRKKPMT